MKTAARLFSFFLLLFFGASMYAQTPFGESVFTNAEIFVAKGEFSWEKDKQLINDKEQLPFIYEKDDQVAEIYIYKQSGKQLDKLRLIRSGDFSIVDSILTYKNYIRFKLRFNDLTNTDFLKLVFEVQAESDTASSLVELPLYPYTDTYVEFPEVAEEVYIGEEKIFPLTTNNVKNIKVNNRWTEGLPINYKTTREGDQLLLHLLPNELNYQQINIELNLKKPILKDGEFVDKLPPIKKGFNVQASRLEFLQFEKPEITPREDRTEAIEIQMDNSRLLQLNKTYRIENQEERGGALIAELYTKTRLYNGKVLCLLRPYAYHRKSEGYLYIKDGDQSRFVTNIDITPKTSIESIYIQRNGSDWVKSTEVYPGETINLKLEGEGLHKAHFTFPGANNLSYDSLIKNEKISLFRLEIPLDVNTRSIEIFNHNENTGESLRIKEYQKPRNFDFIDLDLGTRKHTLSAVDKPIYYDETLTDLVFDFNRDIIDQPGDLHGKQYITINVKVSNKKGVLQELYQFEQVVVCPSVASPRAQYYKTEDCQGDDINLNNFLRKKTSELEEWSRIEIEVAHDKEKYGGNGKKKKFQVILRRQYNFDIDVSFPAGLLILKGGKNSEITNFGGVSFAMLAQFSFYQPGKIAKYQPYKVGAGFIAIDAFNFGSTTDRQDIGLVVIGSLYPTSSDNKLTFPLYMGAGYLLKDQQPFILIGPGIRVRL